MRTQKEIQYLLDIFKTISPAGRAGWSKGYYDALRWVLEEAEDLGDKCPKCGGPATHPSGLCRDCYQGKLETKEAEG